MGDFSKSANLFLYSGEVLNEDGIEVYKIKNSKSLLSKLVLGQHSINCSSEVKMSIAFISFAQELLFLCNCHVQKKKMAAFPKNTELWKLNAVQEICKITPGLHIHTCIQWVYLFPN
uniref:Uncharacterized protein n=1 Tax=Pyxicephalus adspersus TaxID=30357 RepID=A0AAV3B0R0_PYXAD|nr:TPA: hypothetical protein GDO54_006265 [Pyxicephalus adspersus]